jgi:hypothetical protein
MSSRGSEAWENFVTLHGIDYGLSLGCICPPKEGRRPGVPARVVADGTFLSYQASKVCETTKAGRMQLAPVLASGQPSTSDSHHLRICSPDC